jgi:hypothetical protein
MSFAPPIRDTEVGTLADHRSSPMSRLLLQIAFVLALALPSPPSRADAPLATALGLDVAQARQVDRLEADHRKAFAAGRQAFNREARALRRARIANDAAEIARLEPQVEAMRQDLGRMRDAHDAAIRGLLRPEQSLRFDAYLAERRQMRGSSRDETVF